MFSTVTIIFREFFEISIILSVILFTTKNIFERNLYVAIGLVFGVTFSIFLALGFHHLTNSLNGFGQEFLDVFILTIAVLMVSYTVIFIGKQSKDFSKNLSTTAELINSGKKPLIAISIIIASTLIREGMEIILFLNGLYSSGVSLTNMINGALIGSIFAILLGYFVYLGLLKFTYKYVFFLTSWLLIFFSATMASKIPLYLASADVMTFLNDPLWNSSWLLSEHSIIGKILGVLIGYDTDPTGMQLIFYLSTIAFISYNLYSVKKNPKIA